MRLATRNVRDFEAMGIEIVDPWPNVVWDPLPGEFGGVRTWAIWPFQLDPARPSEPFDLTAAVGDGDAAVVALARVVVRAYLERFIGEYLPVNEDYR